MGDEEDGLLYRCAGSKADRMLFRFGGKAFFAVVGVFIKSALTAEQCVSTKGQKRMKKKILRTASFALATALSLSVCASAFVSDGTNNNVTTSVLPDSADNAVLNWATKVGKSWNDGPSPVAIVGDDIVYTSGDKLMRMNKETGVVDSVVGQRAGTNGFSAVQPVTYADGMIFSAFNGGVQAFDAETFESLWVYKDELGGQGVCPIYYEDGCIYTGFWSINYNETDTANYVCIDVKDEDPTKTDEAKSAKWTYANEGGFYYAGAYSTDKFIVVGSDNGTKDNSPADVITLDKETGKVIDKAQATGDIRSSITYDKDTDAYYFTSKSNGTGYFNKVKIDTDGKFTKAESIELDNESTATPTILNGRAYVGYGTLGSGSVRGIAVIDLDSFEIAYKAKTNGYPQASGLGVVNKNGYNYVYFPENEMNGAIRYVKDKKGVTKVIDPQVVNGTEYAPVLFTPTGAQAQYALADLIADEDGTIFFKNDSGYIMAVGSEVEKLVTENAKTVCKEDEAYDASDLKVYAVLKNGVKKDVTDYVTIDDTALTADDDFVTVTYKYGMYRDKTNDGAANTTGVAVSPVEATIDVTVLAAEDYDSVKAVEKLISDLGEITLDSENDIKAARAAYDALGDLKEYVGNVDALTAAEEKLEELKTPSSSSEAESSVSSSDVSSESTVSSAYSEDTSSATSSAAESVSSADSSKTANNAGAANPNTGATTGVCVAGLALLISGALTASRKRK